MCHNSCSTSSSTANQWPRASSQHLVSSPQMLPCARHQSPQNAMALSACVWVPNELPPASALASPVLYCCCHLQGQPTTCLSAEHQQHCHARLAIRGVCWQAALGISLHCLTVPAAERWCSTPPWIKQSAALVIQAERTTEVLGVDAPAGLNQLQSLTRINGLDAAAAPAFAMLVLPPACCCNNCQQCQRPRSPNHSISIRKVPSSKHRKE